MTQTVYFCKTVTEARAYANENGGMVLSGLQHPLDNHKVMARFRDGLLKLIVCDATMAAGWQLNVEATVEMSESFIALGPPYTTQARSRIRNPRAFTDAKATMQPQVEDLDDGGE